MILVICDQQRINAAFAHQQNRFSQRFAWCDGGWVFKHDLFNGGDIGPRLNKSVLPDKIFDEFVGRMG